MSNTRKESYFNRKLQAIWNSETRTEIESVVWLTTLDWYLGDVITTDNYHQLVGAALERINELKEAGK